MKTNGEKKFKNEEQKLKKQKNSERKYKIEKIEKNEEDKIFF